MDRNGPKRANDQSRPKGLVCVTLHITQFRNNQVMWKTLLGTWITFGLHLDQSEYLGWGWDHTTHNSILLLSSIFITQLLRIWDTWLPTIINSPPVLQNLQQSEILSSIALSYIRLESTISRANSSKILHSKTLLTVIIFKITHWWCSILYSFLDDASSFIVYVDCDEIGCLASQMLCC